MKKLYILCLIFAFGGVLKAQQCMTLSKSCSEEIDSDNMEEKPSPIGLLGMGNLNSESFEKANASGKITAYVRLFEDFSRIPKNLTFYLSYNKNITRGDSLSLKSLIFPDLGNNAFDATLEYSVRFKDYDLSLERDNSKYVGHYLIPFLETWIKDFKVGKADSTMKQFVTTNATVGLRYVFHYEKEEEINAFFSAAVYYTHNRILSKDKAEFSALVDDKTIQNKMPLKYNSLGVKLSVEYNKFQFFIDARTVVGKESQIPNKELRGFTYNIGFVTSTSIFGK